MTKQNKAKGLDNFRGAGANSAPGSVAALPMKNPVAKFAHRFNKAQVFADKRHYQRKAKHKGQEPFSIVSGEMIEKGSKAFAAEAAH